MLEPGLSTIEPVEFYLVLVISLHTDGCQGDSGSSVESIGAPVKQYALGLLLVKCV